MSVSQLCNQKSLIFLVFLLAVSVCVLPVAAEEPTNQEYSFWTPGVVYIDHPTSGYGAFYEYPDYPAAGQTRGQYKEIFRSLTWSVNTSGVLDILQPEGNVPYVYLRGISPGTVKITVSDPKNPSWTNSSVVSVEPGVVVESREDALTEENSSRYVQTPESISIGGFNEPYMQMGSSMIWAEILDQFEMYYEDEIVWTSSNPEVILTPHFSNVMVSTEAEEATATITATSRSYPRLNNTTVVTVYSSRLVPSLWIQNTIPADTWVNVTLMVSASEYVEDADLRLTDEAGKDLWNSTEDISEYWYSDAVQVNLPEGTHTLTFTATGAGKTRFVSQTVTAKVPTLSITEQNKVDWNARYGYDAIGYIQSNATIGTYFTSDTSMNGVQYAIDFGEEDIGVDDSQLSGSIDVFNSSENMLYQSLGLLAAVGEFPYTITIGSGENAAVVEGTLTVTDVPVDIKVLVSGKLDSGSGDLSDLAVYNREFSNKSSRQLEIAVSAGTAGRTLQGLEYLIGYPHGCPEQVTSPMLAAVQMKKYYAEKGLLTDSLNATIRQSAQKAINEYLASPSGADAQQINGVGRNNGGWAWGTSSTPSLYYTAYPMYGIAVLMDDIAADPGFWTNKDAINLAGVDLNESTGWLKNNDRTWNTYVPYMIYAVQALDASLPYLDDTAAQDAKDMLNSSAVYLRDNTVSDYKADALISLVLSNKTAQDPTLEARIQDYAEYLNTTYLPETHYNWETETVAQAVYALTLLEDEKYDAAVQKGVEELTAAYGTSGRWFSTYTTAVVIRALNAATAGEDPLAGLVTVTVDIEGLESQYLTLTKTAPSQRVTLSGAQLDGLYGDTPADLTRSISVSSSPATKILVAVTSKEQMPKSVAYSTGDGYTPIPDVHIDPIANDMFLTVVSSATAVPMNTEQIIDFTMSRNSNPSVIDQLVGDRSVMILEIQTGEKIRFNTTKYGVTGGQVAYISDAGRDYIQHRYDADTGKLYVYPGSDAESRNFDDLTLWSNAIRTVLVPLEFTGAGPATIEARLYPMADDEWMALGSTTVQVLGVGKLTISAYDADYNPLTAAEFELTNVDDGSQADSFTGAVYTDASIPEGTYSVTITNASSGKSKDIPNLVFNAGSDLTYSVYFMPDGVVYSGNDGPAREPPAPIPAPSDNGGADDGAELLASAGVKPPVAPTKVPTASPTVEATTSADPSATGSTQPSGGDPSGQQTAGATSTATPEPTATATPTQTQAPLPLAGILAGLGAAAVLLRRP